MKKHPLGLTRKKIRRFIYGTGKLRENSTEYNFGEIFAGAGGMALGLTLAGLHPHFLIDNDADSCATLKMNRPAWKVQHADVRKVKFRKYKDKITLLAGGWPCQPFSEAGKRLGLKDTRGTLFYEFARAVKQTRPSIFLAENVAGLTTNNKGLTFETVQTVLKRLNYRLKWKIFDAYNYDVPQHRRRIFIIGVRKDLPKFRAKDFPKPSPYKFVLQDVLTKKIQDKPGSKYSELRRGFYEDVPEGGNWHDLKPERARELMGISYMKGTGGCTGFARRLAYDQPSVTLLASPSQKATERIHPEFTRPLNTREYARIQTFPDTWEFHGRIHSIYKQIGNAVPVLLAYHLGRAMINYLERV